MSARPEKLVILFAVAAMGLSLAPGAATAGIKCKSKTVSIGALTEDEAIAAWRNKVKGSLGAAWSDWTLARGKNFSQVALPVQNMTFVSAYPCRRD